MSRVENPNLLLRAYVRPGQKARVHLDVLLSIETLDKTLHIYLYSNLRTVEEQRA